MLGLWSSYKFGIGIGISVVCVLGLFVGVAILLDVLITSSNATKYSAIGTIMAALGTIVAAIGAVGALYFVGHQATHLKRSVDLQREEAGAQAEEFHLERRPYLFVEPKDVRVWRNEEEKSWFGGGDFYFSNVGQDPATIVESYYMACTDAKRDCRDFKHWFEKDSVGFSEIKTVMHGQAGLKVPCHPIVAPYDKQPRLLYIGAVISYIGPKREKKYWYKYTQIFALGHETIKTDTGGLIVEKLYPGKIETDWDRNQNTDPRALQPPDWDKYLAKNYVKRITQKNK